MDSIGIDGCSQFQLFVSFGRHVLQTRIPFPKTGAGKTRTDEFGPERKSHMLLFWVIHPHQPALSMLVTMVRWLVVYSNYAVVDDLYMVWHITMIY